jgi:hypothetical protein
MNSILAGFQNSGMGPFSRNDFSDEDFQVASIICGGSKEPSVLTAKSRDLTSTYAGSSLEKKVTPKQVYPYPRAAPGVSLGSGRVQGNQEL